MSYQTLNLMTQPMNYQLANLVASKQLRLGDVVVIAVDRSGKKLSFFRDDNETSLAAAALQSARSLRVVQA